MAGTLKKISGPAYLANAAANIYTPPAATIQTDVRQIHLANKTGAAVTATLYVGATGGSAGGTEILSTVSIPANSVYDMYFSPALRLQSTDFLSGLAGSASAITITVLGEQSVV